MQLFWIVFRFIAKNFVWFSSLWNQWVSRIMVLNQSIKETKCEFPTNSKFTFYTICVNKFFKWNSSFFFNIFVVPIFGRRHVQCLLLFFGLAVIYAMRVNLSVAIVAMMDKNASNPDFPVSTVMWKYRIYTIKRKYLW